jgi:hypothetical protein
MAQNYLEDAGDDDSTIPLPNVESEILKHVIEVSIMLRRFH